MGGPNCQKSSDRGFRHKDFSKQTLSVEQNTKETWKQRER